MRGREGERERGIEGERNKGEEEETPKTKRKKIEAVPVEGTPV